MFENCTFYRQFFLNYPSKIKNYKIRKLAAHDLRWENFIFWCCAALSYHANNHTLIIYFKNKYVIMYPNLFYSRLKISCLRNVQNFIDLPQGFNFIKTVYELIDNLSYLCKSSFTMYNIREGYNVYFSNCVKNVRVQVLSDSGKLSRRLMQKILYLLS